MCVLRGSPNVVDENQPSVMVAGGAYIRTLKQSLTNSQPQLIICPILY